MHTLQSRLGYQTAIHTNDHSMTNPDCAQRHASLPDISPRQQHSHQQALSHQGLPEIIQSEEADVSDFEHGIRMGMAYSLSEQAVGLIAALRSQSGAVIVEKPAGCLCPLIAMFQ